MFKKLKLKLKYWIITTLKLHEINEDIINLDSRIKIIERLTQIGMDVHTQSDSWVVICLKGKVDVVNFYRLPHNNVREVHHMMQDLQKRYGQEFRCDTPPFMREMRLI
jgi:hypothetical protein